MKSHSKIITLFVVGVLAATQSATAVGAGQGAAPLDPNTTVTSDGRMFNVANIFPAQAVQQDGAAWTLPYVVAASAATTPDRVIGSDDRVQVVNTQTFPYSAVVYISTANGRCSGFMIGPAKVATAAHCLHYGGAWVTVNYVVPGKNGSSEPYGRCGVTNRLVTSGWTQGNSPDYDYGAVKLNCTIGYTTGWWGLYTNTNNWYFQGRGAVLTGYPGDKPLGTMWQGEGAITSVFTRQFFYTNDTYRGASGSPLWAFHPEVANFLAEAVNAKEYDPPRDNSGTRITQEVFNNLVNW